MAVLDRVPVERITEQAREVDIGRTVLTLIAGFFYVIGWVAGKVFTVVFFALAWSATAVKLGWTEARKPSGGRRGPA